MKKCILFFSMFLLFHVYGVELLPGGGDYYSASGGGIIYVPQNVYITVWQEGSIVVPWRYVDWGSGNGYIGTVGGLEYSVGHLESYSTGSEYVIYLGMGDSPDPNNDADPTNDIQADVLYDFTQDFFANGMFASGIFTLQALIDGVWSDVESLFVPGANLTTGPQPYQFGAHVLPAGITEFRVDANLATATPVSGATANPDGTYAAGDVIINKYYEGDGGTSGSFMPSEIANFHNDTVVGDQVVGTPVDNIPNTTNSALQNATEVAAGVIMAKETLTASTEQGIKKAESSIKNAVKEGVDSSGLGSKLDAIKTAIDGKEMSVTANFSINDDGQTFAYTDSTAQDPNYTNDITNIEKTIDTVLERVVDLLTIVRPEFPESLGTVSTIQAGHYSITLPEEVTSIREFVKWTIHILFWATVLLIIRSGVA